MLQRSLASTLILLALACAHDAPDRRRLADGSYRLECEVELSKCLAKVEEVCGDHGYDVVQAKEERRRAGPIEMQGEHVVSDAVVRCRRPDALLSDPTGPAASAGPGAPAPSAAARCFPGSTQRCVGPGACEGAQTCRADGLSFGACDCGAAPADAGAEPASAAPVETWAAPPDDAGTAP